MRFGFAFLLSVLCACQFDASGTATRSTDASPPSNDGAVAIDSRPAPIDAEVLPAATCLEILDTGRSLGDGVYEIDPDGSDGPEPPFDAYCDMTTSGGGWTLVYAYTFTDFSNYTSGANAVTPRPTWTFSGSTSVPVSQTAPTGLNDFAALEFSRWKEIGHSFLVRSNINHWLVCNEDGGSLVDELAGAIDCTLVRLVAEACTDVVPTDIFPDWSGRGPTLNAQHHYYYWEGTVNANWPTHDPCGQNQANHRKDVLEPYGAILLR